MRTELNVSYKDKDKVKALGARWDSARKKWYVENIEDLNPFLNYLQPHHRKAIK